MKNRFLLSGLLSFGFLACSILADKKMDSEGFCTVEKLTLDEVAKVFNNSNASVCTVLEDRENDEVVQEKEKVDVQLKVDHKGMTQSVSLTFDQAKEVFPSLEKIESDLKKNIEKAKKKSLWSRVWNIFFVTLPSLIFG